MLGPGADEDNDGRTAMARRDQEQWTWRSKEGDGGAGGVKSGSARMAAGKGGSSAIPSFMPAAPTQEMSRVGAWESLFKNSGTGSR